MKTRLTRVLGIIAAVWLGGAVAAPPAFAGGSVQPWPITITV